MSVRPQKFFAHASRSWLKLLDASDGAAHRKIKNEEDRAAARALFGGVPMDTAGTHA